MQVISSVDAVIIAVMGEGKLSSREIAEKISRVTNRNMVYTPTTLSTHLHRMAVLSGLVRSERSSTNGDGPGPAPNLYFVTEDGKRALANLKAILSNGS